MRLTETKEEVLVRVIDCLEEARIELDLEREKETLNDH